MHFYKKTSIGKSNNYIKLLIKLILAFLLFIAILFMLDDRNICVSTGSACESGSLEASHVLKSMEISRNMINGAIRFSLGRYSTENDVNRVLEELPNIIKKCRELVPHLK